MTTHCKSSVHLSLLIVGLLLNMGSNAAAQLDNFVVEASPTALCINGTTIVTITARDAANDPIPNFDPILDITISTNTGGDGTNLSYTNGLFGLMDHGDGTATIDVSGADTFDPNGQYTLDLANALAEGPITITATDGSATGNTNDSGTDVTWISQPVLHVDAGVIGGSSNGTTWQDAFLHLQDALAIAAACGEIWVAEGTYMPDGGAVPIGGGLIPGTYDRNATFQLLNDVAIYGGFPTGGGDGTFDARDPNTYETILSGDLYDNDLPNFENYGENSYHVVSGGSADATAALDGFTVTAGNANDGTWGGGMLNVTASPTIANCTFSKNQSNASGGGMCNRNGSNPTVINCTFSGNGAPAGGGMSVDADSIASNANLVRCAFDGNTVGDWGGGLFIRGGDSTLTDCTFTDNSTTSQWGGGLFIWDDTGTIRLTGCLFSGNSADQGGGGGMANSTGGGSQPVLDNCTFIGNTAAGGAGINVSGISTVINCSFSGNSSWGSYGGAINNYGTMTVINSSFSGNSVVFYGGAIHNWGEGSVLEVFNCTFSGNSSSDIDGYGGAISSGTGTPLGTLTVMNCTFSGNSAAGKGGGIWSYANTTVTNCVFWENIDSDPSTSVEWAQLQASPVAIVAHTLIQGLDTYSGGVGNIDGDPRFVDADGPDDVVGTADDDLRMLAGSPAIDAADNTAVPADDYDLDGDEDTTEQLPIDLAGQDRFVEDPATPDTGVPNPEHPEVVDMGAYEHQPEDCNANDIPDICDVDCGQPGGPCDLPGCGQSNDLNSDDVPDECEPDCNGNEVPDDWDIATCPPETAWCDDCNNNGIPDDCDIDASDPDGNGEVSDDCQNDGAGDGVPDECQETGDVASTWIGDIGLWGTHANWCPDVVPNNDVYANFSVSIDGSGQEATLDASPTLDGLSLWNGAMVLVRDESGADVRTLAVGSTIVNEGVFRATDAERFVLDAPVINQVDTNPNCAMRTGGVLEATDGDFNDPLNPDLPADKSILEINGSQVIGGVARTVGANSEIHLIGGAELVDVCIEGVVVPDGQVGAFSGSIENDGVLQVAPQGLQSTLLEPGSAGATLVGKDGIDDSVRLGGESAAMLGSFLTSFTNAGNHKIEGAGIIFGGMTNEGTIQANISGETLFVFPPGGKTSNGSFMATGGGTLWIADDISGTGSLAAIGGTIRVDADEDDVTVDGDGPIIVLPSSPGLIEVNSASLIGADSWTIGDDQTGPEMTATMRLVNNALGSVDGPVIVRQNGTLEISGSVLTAIDLTLETGATLTVASEVILQGSLSNAKTSGGSGSWSWAAGSSLAFEGGLGAVSEACFLTGWTTLEAASEDLGGAGGTDDFEFQGIVLADGAHLSLLDTENNHEPPGGLEAVYCDTLTLGSGAVLNLNGLGFYVGGIPVTPGPYGGGQIQDEARVDLRGDANGDTVVDGDDVEGIVAVLLGLDGTPAGMCAADMNEDGSVDGRDVQPFVEAVTAS